MDSELIKNIKDFCHVESLDIANDLLSYSYNRTNESCFRFQNFTVSDR